MSNTFGREGISLRFPSESPPSPANAALTRAAFSDAQPCRNTGQQACHGTANLGRTLVIRHSAFSFLSVDKGGPRGRGICNLSAVYTQVNALLLYC